MPTLPFGKLAGEEFDLIADGGGAIDEDDLLAVNPATAAFGSITGLAQKLFRSYLNVQLLGAEDQFLKTGFLLGL